MNASLWGAWGLVGAALLGGCAHRNSQPSPASACQRVADAPLPAGTSTSPMAGEFVLTMVATAGPKAGRSVTGRLSLVPQDSALRQVERATQSLRGTADIALDSVGAVRFGDLAATAPDAPGVAVYEQRASDGTPTVVIRFGNESNARGPQAFDAGHTAAYVRQISRDAFAGGWSSALSATFPPRHAEGYFCARRPLP